MLARIHAWLQTWAGLLVSTGTMLLISWSMRAPCLSYPVARDERPLYCISDVRKLYEWRGFDQDLFPYVQSFNEYPILTGLFQYAMARLSETPAQFLGWNAFFLAIAVVATSLLLRGKRQWMWAASPAIAFYAFHNWDALVVPVAMAGLLLFERQRYGLAGFTLAVAGMIKWYPLLFLPILGIAILRKDNGLRKDGWFFGTAAVCVLAGLNAPFAMANLKLWKESYTFHGDRVPNFESMWRWVPDSWTPGVDAISTTVILGAIALGGVAVWRGANVRLACFGVLMAFLTVNKVFSVQYALWILAFMATIDLPTKRALAFMAADVAVWFSVWPMIDERGLWASTFYSISWAIRLAIMLWILQWTVREIRSQMDDREPGPPESTIAPG